MTQDVLTVAKKYLRRRKFAAAIRLLEGKQEVYGENFEYHLLLGIACLYIGDIGAAVSSFSNARRIKLTDTRLLLGQAAIFLRRGDTARALQYYVEIIENEPGNKTAVNAMEFIRTHSDNCYDTICRWVDTGRIEQFYPPLGVNPQKIAAVVIPVLAGLVGCVIGFVIFHQLPKPYDDSRVDLSTLVLSDSEKKSPQTTDLSTQSYHYILSNKEITDSYEKCLRYFQSHRDNAAQIEINRILNSNASLSIKQKSQSLMTYLEAPTFDTLTDNPSVAQVREEPALYLDCYVSWGGRITAAKVNPDGSYSCQLLVGYETGENVEDIVTVKFAFMPDIATDQPVKILGKILTEDNKVYLQGRSVYQSVKDGLL